MNNIIRKYKLLSIPTKASIWFVFSSFLQKGITVITTPIFTRILTTSEYGEYSVFNSWLGIITVFVSLNLYSGVYMQGMIKFEQQRGEFSSSLQGLFTTLVLLWSIIYFLFMDFWNSLFSLSSYQMLSMFIIIWSTGIFIFWSVEQRIKLKYKQLVIVTLIASILRPLVGVLLVVYSSDKVTARIFAIAAVDFIAYSGFFITKLMQERIFFSKRFWKYAILFNLPLIPHYLSTTILNSADRIMITTLINSEAAGIYSLAYSISLLMSIFSTALMQTVEPWIFKKINEKKAADIGKVAYPLFVLVAVLNICLIAIAPELVSIFAPTQYYDAIWIIPPVSMSVFFTFAYTFFVAFQFYFEKRIYVMISTSIGAIVNVILNYIFISMFGYYAAGYTTLLCYMIYALCHYLSMKKVCREKVGETKVFDGKILLVIVGTFLLVGFVFLITYNYTMIRYFLICTLGITVVLFKNKFISLFSFIVKLKK